MKKYNISGEILEKILKNVFSINNNVNADNIFDILMHELPDHAKEHLLQLSLMDKEYEVLAIGDYVKFQPPSHHEGSRFEWDVLEDLKLVAGPKMAYGKVVGDTSWGSDYSPFASRLKLEVLYHDENKQLEYQEHEIQPLECIKINEEDIGYFNILDSDNPLIPNTDV